MRVNCERCGAAADLVETPCKCGNQVTICKACLPLAGSCISDIPCQVCRMNSPAFQGYYNYLFGILEDPRR